MPCPYQRICIIIKVKWYKSWKGFANGMATLREAAPTLRASNRASERASLRSLLLAGGEYYKLSIIRPLKFAIMNTN